MEIPGTSPCVANSKKQCVGKMDNMAQPACTVFLHSCRFLYYPPLDTNETALHCREGRFFRLLHEKRGLLGSLSGDTKGGQHWRKTVLEESRSSPSNFMGLSAPLQRNCFLPFSVAPSILAHKAAQWSSSPHLSHSSCLPRESRSESCTPTTSSNRTPRGRS